MYKYKKTIIINNRKRRIFSKKKSNTEYILYKNDYITLNAYNKKTGGSMSNLIARKILSNEKNEFEIPKNEFEIPIDNKNQYNENINLFKTKMVNT